MSIQWLWLAILLPLAAAISIACFLRTRPRLAAVASIAAVAVSFVVCVVFLVEGLGQPGGLDHAPVNKGWLTVPGLQLNFGILLDNLSILMGIVVAGVGGLIHVYSLGYFSCGARLGHGVRRMVPPGKRDQGRK